MGIAERKEKQKEDMKRNIQSVAFEMFIKEGYAGTSLREIAKKIEYSPATIYLYYKDKDALFFDIQILCFKELIKSYAEVVKIKNPFERLRQMGIAYMKHNMENPQCFNLMFLHDSPLAELKKEDRMDKYGNAINFLKETVKECIEEKMISETDEIVVRLEVWGLTHGLSTLFVHRSYEGMGLTKEEAKDYMLQSWEKYLSRIKS